MFEHVKTLELAVQPLFVVQSPQESFTARRPTARHTNATRCAGDPFGELRALPGIIAITSFATHRTGAKNKKKRRGAIKPKRAGGGKRMGEQMQSERRVEEPTGDSQNSRWGVILAGGDGKRLLPLTRKIAGDDRPKQFCSLTGRETLLAKTRSRVSRMIHPDRTLLTLTKSHERFYADEVTTVAPARLLVQPQNKGTAPSIVYSVMRVHEADPGARVAFFPSDHHFADEEALTLHIDLAFTMAEFHSDLVMLLGIAPEGPEAGYGWIEPGRHLSNPLHGCAHHVRRFWEKPSQAIASTLLERGCLWNSFVMVGHVGAFVSLIRRTLPTLLASIESLGPPLSTVASSEGLCDLYSSIPTTDFSRDALSARPGDLAVLRGIGLGWSDLGDLHRVHSALGRNGTHFTGTG